MDILLKKLGFDKSFYKEHILNITLARIARVTVEHKGSYEIITAGGEHTAVITGKKMLLAINRDDYPAVGDWVILKDSLGDLKIIEEILPRKTTLHKKYGGKNESQLIAANVDVAFIVGSIGRDFSLNRLERYVVLAQDGGLKPVILINKSDLITEAEKQIIDKEIKQRFGAVDVIITSTITNSGLVLLANYIKPGITYCFLGSSGVGKSSLINKLLGKETIVTKSVGSKTGRGKHTTTTRQMHFMGNGGIIIDNPGCREVGITSVGTGLKNAYTNIEDLTKKCKFKDCTHTNEPGCAVVQALKDDLIDASQYNNYNKLHKEAEYYELSAYEKRQKNKNFSKFVKNAKKEFKEYNQ